MLRDMTAVSGAELPPPPRPLPPPDRRTALRRDAASGMHAGSLDSSPHSWPCPRLPSPDRAELVVATPPPNQRSQRRQRSHRRSGRPCMEALLAVVQQSLKAARLAQQASGTRMAKRSMLRRSYSPAAQLEQGGGGGSAAGTVAAAQVAHTLALSTARAAAMHRQQVFAALLKGMHPFDAANLLRAKRFLGTFPAPSAR